MSSSKNRVFDGGKRENLVGFAIIVAVSILLLLSVNPISKYVKTMNRPKNTEKIYTKGVYEGTYKGFAGEVITSITVSETEIETIKIIGKNETQDIGGKAMTSIEARVLENQDINFDLISGATITSLAVKKGLEEALAKAKGEEYIKEEEVDINSSSTDDGSWKNEESVEVIIDVVPRVKGEYIDGIYESVVDGYNDKIKIKVEVKDSDIIKIEVLEHSESKGLFENAYLNVVSKIIETQNFDVDIVAGASVTSKAIIDGVKKALEIKN